jgi:RHH-type rel operon transcriptional repressor/antitoxin RelB
MTAVVRLPEKLEARLSRLASETKRTKSFYIRKALEDYLENQEDYLLALAVRERIRKGQERTYTLSEAKKILDLKGD